MSSVQDIVREHPRKIDYAVILALLTALFGAIIYVVGAEIQDHNINPESHPTLVAKLATQGTQLNRVEANQIREMILRIDSLLCEDPKNAFYRQELSDRISEWERLTGKQFPRELLRCA